MGISVGDDPMPLSSGMEGYKGVGRLATGEDGDGDGCETALVMARERMNRRWR